jgi:hypothetical protein
MMTLLLLLAFVVGTAVLAPLYGVDSRDRCDGRPCR